MASMKAVGVATYGPVDNFQSRDIPKPGEPTGRDVLVKEVLNPQSFYLSNNIDRVKACSVNPIDTKIRGGTYDDAPGKK
jgi:NADPH:quinone reductase-like Zn-dependent oxidoreductase